MVNLSNFGYLVFVLKIIANTSFDSISQISNILNDKVNRWHDRITTMMMTSMKI